MHRIVLVKFTGDSMADSPGADWHRRVRDLLDGLASEELDGALIDVSWTLGSYDAVVRVDLPSEQATTAFSLTLSRKLRAHTTTLTALDDDEMDFPMDFAARKNGLMP